MSKRVLKTFLSVSLAAAMAFGAASCISKPSDNDDENEETTAETTEENILRPVIEETTVTETTETEPTAETTLDIEYIVDTCLLGNWTYEDEGYVYTYTFNNDNTGYFNIADTDNEGSDIGLDFVYTANGSSFTMYYDGEEGDTANYSINGDILTIDTGADEPVELTR